jgi:hypothetical protein
LGIGPHVHDGQRQGSAKFASSQSFARREIGARRRCEPQVPGFDLQSIESKGYRALLAVPLKVMLWPTKSIE